METTSFIKVFLFALLAKLATAGGDDPCGDPSMPFKRADIIARLQKIEAIFSFINATATTNINVALINSGLTITEQISLALSNLQEASELFQQSGINVSLDNVTSLISSFINTTFATDADKNIAKIHLIMSESAVFIDEVYASALDLIAPEVGLNSLDLVGIVSNSGTSVDYPLTCIIDDILFLHSLKVSIIQGILDRGEAVLASITS